ncbi:unnamed protein product [Phytophthora lilii]|uniref:Unnamed protein product n=1 Tax=Phytophthora lilii TaxID=2077276 RepID=A0A9W6TD71_9STRA|nr:unnamed protein product [Phytophthora lilii]
MVSFEVDSIEGQQDQVSVDEVVKAIPADGGNSDGNQVEVITSVNEVGNKEANTEGVDADPATGESNLGAIVTSEQPPRQSNESERHLESSDLTPLAVGAEPFELVLQPVADAVDPVLSGEEQADEEHPHEGEPLPASAPADATETTETEVERDAVKTVEADTNPNPVEGTMVKPDQNSVDEDPPTLAPENSNNATAANETVQAEHPVESAAEAGDVKQSEAVTETNRSRECLLNVKEKSSSTSNLPAESTEATNEQQRGDEDIQQDQNLPVGIAEPPEQAEVLTPQQSTEAVPVKPPGFLESLTADFAPDTKAMWAQIFGPRYEEGDEGEDSHADNQSNLDSSIESVSSRISFKAKLARERKLDEQIQASQRRYRERILRNAAANSTAARKDRTKTPHRTQGQVTVPPFEQAGLTLTQVRFCTEKALDETCKWFRRLHALALDEAEDLASTPTQGIYVTQGELEHLLRELFDPQETAPSSANNRKGTLAAPLNFAMLGGTELITAIPMNTQLQASWFIPFGQLPELRSLIMKITKRHLNEDKLAIVNRHLQKQLTLLPLSSKLQNLVLQLSNHHLEEPIEVPIRQRLRSPEDLAQDLLGCISVHGATMTPAEPEDYRKFLLFLPVIANERLRSQSKSTESLPAPVLERTAGAAAPKKKSMFGKRKKSFPKGESGSTDAARECGEPEDAIVNSEEATSVHAAHGSLPSASETCVEEAAESDPFPNPQEQIGDQCEKPESKLQQQLESAIAQLRLSLPTIDFNIDHGAKVGTINPATRATYLAAVACQQSVHVMVGECVGSDQPHDLTIRILIQLENSIDVDAAMSNKLRHFIEALQAIQTHIADQSSMVHAPSPDVNENSDTPFAGAPQFPPPYPESTVPEENDIASESGTSQSRFPPPYAITTPSYWTFTPSIPEPKSSIAKLATKSPNCKTADLRSHFMANDSPAHSSIKRVAPSATSEMLPKESIGKQKSQSTSHQRMKTSLAFVPPIVQSTESNEHQLERKVHVASQYDDNHLRTVDHDAFLNDFPPQYEGGDANEAPAERADDELNIETDMDRALRLQQQIFMNAFVQQVVSNQASPPHFVPRAKTDTERSRRSGTAFKPYWATSEVSPGIERLLRRQRRAPFSSKSRAHSSSTVPVPNPVQSRQSTTTKRIVKTKPQSPPPRGQLDNDQHLAWAARISELYQPPVSTPDQS